MPSQFPALTLTELSSELGSRTRALEALKWLYAQPSLPDELPERIEGVAHREWSAFKQRTAWAPPQVLARRESPDGPAKLALRFGDVTVETVGIAAKGRHTVCVSSQAGCTRQCQFCATQTLVFKRSLTAAKMIFQFLAAR